VERDSGDSVIHANLKMDGTRSNVLMIPAGGFRLPSSPATAVLEDGGDNNLRAKDHLHMEGPTVFNFVQAEVPRMIDDLLKYAGATMDEVDYFFCHQPNRFMLQKLADKMQLPYPKMPSNVVEQFGNSSGVTIPITITSNLRDRLMHEQFRVCMAGYGVGLTWSSMLLDLGKVKFNTIIEYK
jgi:3-oxoacyl-[acyl-carrier-protein] synthase-3